MEQGNIFGNLPSGQMSHEVFETLVSAKGLRIERIISTGQATPEGGRRPALVVNQHSDVAVAHGGTIETAAREREGLGDARHRDQVFRNDGKTAGPAAADMVIKPRRP